jgi:phenylacetate-CoA ligase
LEKAVKLRVHGNEVDLAEYHLFKLNELLVFVTQFNKFYQEKLQGVALPLRSLDELGRIPFTTKKELAEDQIRHAPYGRNHTFPETAYIRYHQTSGTSGRPLKILDTKESWEWWQNCWVEVLKSAGVDSSDRMFLAFSFGPFIGFWSAYEAGKAIGAVVIPGGGQSSEDRLRSIVEHQATVLCCTPSYALHLAEVAEKIGIDLRKTKVRRIMTAGEPGGSIPSVRSRIENFWDAKVYDHVGMTEMGAYGYACSEQIGIHVNEEQFLAEVINPETLQPVADGERGELVLTNFGRYGFPLIRYRTGDVVVKSSKKCPCGNPYQLFEGGIIGRADDMVIIRGINIFPQSIESIIREFPEITEFRIIYYTVDEMDEVKIQYEGGKELAGPLASRLRKRIGLRIEVEPVEDGTLTRFEMKARRVIDQRVAKPN